MKLSANNSALEKKASAIREKLIEVVSKTGGHLGPNLGVVELTIAIHEIFDSPKDKILFDVGHQSYVHKLLTGRADEFHTLRQKGGITPFTDRKESPHDHFISGHAGSALSAASGIAEAIDDKVIVVIGDASIANGHSLEALNNMGNNCDNIIVILNDNEMSIGENTGSLSNFFGRIMGSKAYLDLRQEIETLVRKGKVGNKVADLIQRVEHGIKNFVAPVSMSESLGFKYIGPINGHNFDELLTSLNSAKSLKGPVFLHVKTQKGRGYLPAIENQEKFHGVAPFCVETGETASKSESYSKVFGDELTRLATKDEDIYAICCGMVKGTGLGEYFEKFENRAFDMGMAEGHSVTFSGGLAVENKKPYVAIYSTFLQRAYAQLIHDISIQNLPVRFILDRSGIVGEDGKTHQGLFDIPYLATVPNFRILSPTTKKEFKEMLEFSATYEDSPLAIRVPRANCWDDSRVEEFEFGKWKEVVKGEKVLLLAVGTMLKEVLDVEKELNEKGIYPTILNASTTLPLDENYLLENLEKYDTIFTLEEGRIRGGFSSLVTEFLNDRGIAKKINRIGIENNFVPHGKRDELLEDNELAGKSLVEKIERGIYAK